MSSHMHAVEYDVKNAQYHLARQTYMDT